MKKYNRVISAIFAVALMFGFQPLAMAAEVQEDPVDVIVEYREGEFLPQEKDVIVGRQARATVDLAEGSSPFTVGELKGEETYTTDTYEITKTTIDVGLQSLQEYSPHIKVTLYKSTGVSVAEKAVSLPASYPMQVGGTVHIKFTNLNTSTKYYAVIENMGTEMSGNIIGVTRQV